MRSLISVLILPLPILVLLIFLGVVFFIWKRNKLFIFISFFWFLLISTPFVPNILASHLEDTYGVFKLDSLSLEKLSVNILVLGGGHKEDSRLPFTDKLSTSALSRLIEGIRLQRQVTGSCLITSGGGRKGKYSQAEVLAKAAVILGIDSTIIRLQKSPMNTWDEALEYKKSYSDSHRLILVTSALHMPRAMYLFNKAGLKPLAAPTDHLIKTNTIDPLFWLPSSYNIYVMESAIHEYVGLLWSKMFI